MATSIPKSVGKYTIIREIARSNDIVYEAWDQSLRRKVALKLLLLPRNASPTHVRDRVSRFQREARAAAQLSHPNIAAVYDYGSEGDDYFIVMEFIEGQTLREFLDLKGHLSTSEAHSVMEQILLALACAHKAGVVHRDVKPENIFVCAGGAIKLADFGIARIQHEPSITVTGQIFGTPSYMSPEQVSGKDVGVQSDLWSAGVVLFEMCAGLKPFPGDSYLDICQKVLSAAPDFSLISDSKCRYVAQGLLTKEISARTQSAFAALRLLKTGPPRGYVAPTFEPTVAYHALGSKPKKTRLLAAIGAIFLLALGVGGGWRLAAMNPTPQVASNDVPKAESQLVNNSPSVSDVYAAAIDRKSFFDLATSDLFINAGESGQKDQLDTWARQTIGSDYFKLDETQRVDLLDRMRVAASRLVPPRVLTDEQMGFGSASSGPVSPRSRLASPSQEPDTLPLSALGTSRRQSRPATKRNPETQGHTFTIGSTEDDVLSVQGTPSTVNDYTYFKILRYGSSDVTIKNGVVTAYDNSGSNLKVSVAPASKTGSKFFTIGSTEDDVLSVQGTPSTVNDYTYFKILRYGSSDVTIKNGVVTAYDNSGSNLKVSVAPASKTGSKFFTIGSTEDDVLSVQGTPSTVNDYTYFKILRYGSSDVTIKNGVVTAYDNSGSNLKVRR